MTVLFWLLLATVAFALVGYGLLVIALASLAGDRPAAPAVRQKATMLIAARNEEADIADKLRSVLDDAHAPHELDIIVVSDGSEDGTVAAARSVGGERVSVLALDTHVGKAAALNRGLARIDADRIVIFSDANSILRPGSVRALLDAFGSPEVGGAVGQLEIAARGGLLAAADRLFWAYDNALKRAEDRLGGAVSAQGTLYAVRRSLIGKVPEAMADDLYISLGAVAAGRRLRFVPEARATEEVTSETGREFGRRVRSTERGWRGLMHYAGLMNPRRTGFYGVQLFCHKFLRRLVAFLLIALFLCSLALAGQSAFHLAAFLCQLAVYGLGLGAWLSKTLARVPGASVASLFTLGHVAMAIGVTRTLLNRRSVKWTPVRNP